MEVHRGVQRYAEGCIEGYRGVHRGAQKCAEVA